MRQVVLVSPYDSKVGLGPDQIITVAEKRLRAGREEELLLLLRLRSAQRSAPITVPGHDGLGPRVSGAVFSATAATAGEPLVTGRIAHSTIVYIHRPP